jgi:hypothetical protein
MTMAHGESVPHSPLTVKEQFEASATRFWSTVTSLNLEEPAKHGCVESSAHHPSDAERAVSIHSVLHAVFGSCTAGSTYEGQPHNRPPAKHAANHSNPITPSSSRGGGTTLELVGPPDATRTTSGSSEADHRIGKKFRSSSSSSRKKFFADSHDRAEEAVLHLREQQLHHQQQLDVKQQHHEEQQQQQTPPERERHCDARHVQDRKAKPDPPEVVPRRKSPFQTRTPNHKKTRPTSGIEHHAFFPASNPQTTKLHPPSKPAVPKEVASPARKPRGKTSDAPPTHTSPPLRNVESTSAQNDKDNDDVSYFDFEDDGVSMITQETIDEMVLALEQEQILFPDAPVLNRVYSDVTDRIDASFADWKETLNLSVMSSTANTSLFPMIEGRTPQEQLDFTGQCGDRISSRFAAGMSPPRLTRQGQSSGTRSFFTKTTHSTQTDDFACAWKRDEQQYWDSLVKEETTPGVGNTRSNPSATSPTSPSRYSKLRRMRDKVKRELFNRPGTLPHLYPNKGTISSVGNSGTTAATTGTGSADYGHTCSSDDEVCRAVHDRLMDAMIQQNEEEMGEI